MANFIFIDGSYFCFFRYYAMLTWWKNAKKDEDALKNPIENETFVTKYKDLFNRKIQEISKKLKIKNPIIIIGKDCHRRDIWRHSICDFYKENRSTDDLFMEGEFFKIAYSELFPNNENIKAIISHKSLEADDCIAIASKYVLEKYPDSKVTIITSDMDYLQLSNERTQLFNLKYKNLCESKNSFGDANKDLFCKIVLGDKSDNISGIFKKCGIKTAEKLYEDADQFIKKINQEKASKLYERNKQLIDFNQIPLEYVNELKSTFDF